MAYLIRNLAFVRENAEELCKNTVILSSMVAIINANHCGTCTADGINSINFDTNGYNALFTLRQITMMTFATISNYFQCNSLHPADAIDFLSALIHFITCPNVFLENRPVDALLGRQFSFEILSKLSSCNQFLEIINQLTISILNKFIQTLTLEIKLNSDSCSRNFSINILLNCLKYNDSIAEMILAESQIIKWLLDFIQESQEKAMNIVRERGLEFFEENTHTIGTEPEFVKMAAELLKKLMINSSHEIQNQQYFEQIARLSVSKLIDGTSTNLMEILRNSSFVSINQFIYSLPTTSHFDPKFNQ